MKSIAIFIGTAVLWFVGEMLVQLLAGLVGLVVHLAFRAVTRPFRDRFGDLPWWTPLAGSALLGAALGGSSLLVFPHLFVERQWMRWVNLLATPIIVGLFVAGAQSWSARRDLRGMPFPAFFCAACLTLAIAITRMAWADTGAPGDGERILLVMGTGLAVLVMVPLAWHAVVASFWWASLGAATTITIAAAIAFGTQPGTTRVTLASAAFVFGVVLAIAMIAGIPFRRDRRRAHEAPSIEWTPRR